MLTITSSDNKIIKETVRLQKASARKERGEMLIDGAREISLAVKSGLDIRSLFYCAELAAPETADAAIKNFFGLPTEKIISVSAEAFRKICYKENPDGFLAVAAVKTASLADIKLDKEPLIIILESVEKPGNLGAILRTAYAAGVSAIIINDGQTDIYNPNVIRASEGYVFAEKVVAASVEETVKWLKENKIRSFAAATSASKNYMEAKLDIPAAIVLGSEAEGLSMKWFKAVDEKIKIPMTKGMDSLNVSVSAAIILFEALRQRKV